MLYIIVVGWPVIALWIVIMWLSWVCREKDQPIKKTIYPHPSDIVCHWPQNTNVISKRRYNF